MLDKTVEVHLLYDCYGALLTERQRRIAVLRYFDDWSLSEIAVELGITRQAVNDAMKKTVAQLAEYERKLGLLAAHLRRRERLRELEARLRERYGVGDDVLAQLRELI